MEGEICLRRGRFVYRGGDSSTEGEIRLRRGSFVYGGGHLSTEWETHVYISFDGVTKQLSFDL